MSKHRLLLADDSVTIQKVVNLTFADEGIEVITVGDGNSAMEKFVEATPDLVMVDVNMPGVDGYRICEMIKQDEETKHVPVILLVGSFEPFDEDEARRVGANDYLTKPFQSIRQLVNKVTVLLNQTNGNEVVVPPLDHTPPVRETPVYQNIAPVQPFEIPVSAETEEVSEPPLGDAGMDDEMIQANQIGSLPVDDVQKLESGNNSEFGSLQNQLRNPTYEPVNQQNFERDENFGKTQPYTAEEFKELASIPAESDELGQTSQSYNSERMSAEERAIALEKQMVSDFETETVQNTSGFELQDSQSQETEVREFSSEISSAPSFRQEQIFTPEEIPAENQIPVEEIPQKQDFAVEEMEPSIDYATADEAADYYDTSSSSNAVLEELYNAPEDTETADSIGREFYSQPETMNAQDISDSFNSSKSFEIIKPEEDPADYSPVQEFQVETPFENERTFEQPVNYSEPEIIEAETSPYNFEEPKTVSEQPTYFEEEREIPVQSQTNVEDETQTERRYTDSSENFPSSRPFDSKQDFETAETADVRDSSEAENTSAESETDYPKSITFSEPESYFSQYNQTLDPETEQVTEEEDITTPTIEIPEAFPTIEEEFYTPEEFAAAEEQSPAEEFTGAEETSPLEAVPSIENQTLPENITSFREEIPVEEQLPAEEPASFEQQIPAEEKVPVKESVLEDLNLIEEPVETPAQVVSPPAKEAPALEVEQKPAAPTVEPQFNSLVSNKEKSEAVESVIVSEFARHSISLSSEAVETIASRIADKISEKIVQQLANDVVGNLADLIVERMERKKLE